MKTRRQTIPFLAMALFFSSIGFAFAQSHGKHNKGNKGRPGVESYHRTDGQWSYHSYYSRDYRHADAHPGYRHNDYRRSPRYVYYRDHNVYYDCDRRVYITSTPRGWNVSHALPLTMRGANLRRTSVFAVDYYGDALTDYVAVRRPAYVSIQWTW